MSSRGRKPSGKPGAKHLDALRVAHGKGDFKAAKTHALNYAKAVHSQNAEPDADDAVDMMAAHATPPTSDARARLAKLAMSRRSKPPV